MAGSIIAPPRLKPGDTIGIAAPAGPFEPKPFQDGIMALEAMGFQVYRGPALFDQMGYLAGTDEARAGDLAHLFRNPEVKAIICARGGYGCMRLLPLIDWEAIRCYPKIFMGFSDITVLLTLFYQRAELMTYHGPVVTQLGTLPDESRAAMVRALTTNEEIVICPARPVVLHPGVAAGPLLGGNLTLLCHLLGTPYAPRVDGHVLFLEDTGEALYRIDRMLWHLKLAGWFDKIAGLVLGRFTDCGGMNAICDLAADLCRGRKIPVLAGFDFGHEAPNLTIPVGGNAVMDTVAGSLQINAPGQRR